VPRKWIAIDSRRSDSLLEAARAYDRLQQLYYHRGEYTHLVLANLTTLNLSERAAPSSYLATAYANAGATAGIIPLRGAAANYFALAESTLAKAYDPDVDMYLRQLHAVYLLGIGQFEDARREVKRSLQLAEDLGSRRRWEENAGVLCIMTSDLDERLEWASRALASARLRSDPQMTSWHLLWHAEVHAARGEFARAAAVVAEVEAMAARLGTLEEMWIFATRSYVSLATGRRDDAEVCADRASDVLKRTGTAFIGLLEAYTRIGEVQVALWTPKVDRSDARERRARAACAALAASARLFPIAVPGHCLCEGTLRWKSGNTKRAVETWQRGLVHARRLRLPYRELQLLRQLAAYMPTDLVGREAAASATDLEAQLGIRDGAPMSSSRGAHAAA
jgi:tetratricopeptide (TPR) repeat protein